MPVRKKGTNKFDAGGALALELHPARRETGSARASVCRGRSLVLLVICACINGRLPDFRGPARPRYAHLSRNRPWRRQRHLHFDSFRQAARARSAARAARRPARRDGDADRVAPVDCVGRPADGVSLLHRRAGHLRPGSHPDRWRIVPAGKATLEIHERLEGEEHQRATAPRRPSAP